MAAGSAPVRQSLSMTPPSGRASSAILVPERREPAGAEHEHRIAGLSVLASAASQAPVAGGGIDDDGVRRPEDSSGCARSTSRPSAPNSGPRCRWWASPWRPEPEAASWRGRGAAEVASGIGHAVLLGGAGNALAIWFVFCIIKTELARGRYEIGAAGRHAMTTALSRDIDLERRLTKALKGESRFDAFTRGRTPPTPRSTRSCPGASFFRRARRRAAALEIARTRASRWSCAARHGSQNGQPIGDGLVLDCSRAFGGVLAYDPAAMTATVQPGAVPRRPECAAAGGRTVLSRRAVDGEPLHHRRHDGQQLLRRALAALRQDGRQRAGGGRAAGFGEQARFAAREATTAQALADDMLRLAERERAEILARYPKVQRRVAATTSTR